MHKVRKIEKRFGGLLLISLFCFINFLTDGQEAQAGVLDFDFTYTSDDTTKAGFLGDTTRFHSVLTNIGTEADSYLVSMTENPPTPIQWWIWFCSGGVCHDTTVTQDTVYLPVGEWDDIFLDIAPRDTCGSASVTMTITSFGTPGLSKSITFLLSVHRCAPVTDRWGLLSLISLILISGLYLILKRLRPARVRSRS